MDIRYQDRWLAGIITIPLYSSGLGSSMAAKTSAEVGKTVQAIAVQIETIGGKNTGSGTILQKQGDLYIVLTTAHVLRNGKQFKITTADGRSYQSVAGSQRQASSNLDLAVVSFRSNNNHRGLSYAKLGNKKAAIADWQKASQISQKLRYGNEYKILQKLIKAI